MIRKSKKHPSSSTLRGLQVRFGMQTHKLHDDMLHRAASASEISDSDDNDSVSSDVGSSGRASAASENDIDDFVEGTTIRH